MTLQHHWTLWYDTFHQYLHVCCIRFYSQNTIEFLYPSQLRLLSTRMMSIMTATPEPSSVAPGEPSVVSKCAFKSTALSSQALLLGSWGSIGQDKRTMMLVTLVYAFKTTIHVKTLAIVSLSFAEKDSTHSCPWYQNDASWCLAVPKYQTWEIQWCPETPFCIA